MGIRQPKLGDSSAPPDAEPTSVVGALFTKTQQRILALFFGQPEREFMMAEVTALANVGSGAVQREVARLVSSGLVSVNIKYGRKVYRANERSVLFDELCSIIAKTSGVAELLRQTLLPHAKDIPLAILFGSVAKGTSRAESDIDIMIVSDNLLLEEIFRILAPLEERLGRTINPTCYTTAEFDARRQAKNPFLSKVLAAKHFVLIGKLDEHQGT